MADFSDLGLFTENRESQWEVALRLRRSPRTNLSDRVLVPGVRRHAYNGWKSWSVLQRVVLGELRDSIPEVTSGVCAVGACTKGYGKPRQMRCGRGAGQALPLTDVRKIRAIKHGSCESMGRVRWRTTGMREVGRIYESSVVTMAW